jgi:hypothetical protein
VRLQGGLGRDVGLAADHARGRRDDRAADVDHAARAPLEHRGQQREGQLGHACDVDGEGAGEGPGVDAGAGPQQRDDPRVIDEDVHAAELVERAPGNRRPGARGGEVGTMACARAPAAAMALNVSASSSWERAATATRAARCAS